MPKINLLPKNVAELIAAGEVVERPASVIKELVENSIDAGATQITVEIQRGGITYIRITDNGSGIEAEDVPTAFLRHATSKIKVDTDLDSIATLGFRGEALAAISSVSKVEMLTRTDFCDVGCRYLIEGGEEKVLEDVGCPKGTTIIIRDIFYNTPARMKFLKKDVSEANACAAVVERIAISHPEIAFTFIRDGKQSIVTTGDNNLKNCVYSVLGRDFTNALIEVNGNSGGVGVSGLTCKPHSCRPTRNGQYTFLNGRLVRSGTVIAAVEQAYKNSSMTGKFPTFVLFLSIPFDTVDVNVHPAKTEVRFSDERRIFEGVYAAVKNAITTKDTRPEVKVNASKPFDTFQNMTSAEYRQQVIVEEKPKETVNTPEIRVQRDAPDPVLRSDFKPDFLSRYSVVGERGQRVEPTFKNHTSVDVEVAEAPIPKPQPKPVEEIKAPVIEEKPQIKLLGEAFSTYIVVEKQESLFMIDKHAAHERILYNELLCEEEIQIQALLTPITATLPSDEYDAIVNNLEILKQGGFEAEDFGNSSVIVREIPASLVGEDIPSLLSEIADGLISTGRLSNERRENVLHTVACRSAVKAGNSLSDKEMLSLAERVLSDRDIMYCPHGRPVAFEIKKRQLEKQFGRIQ